MAERTQSVEQIISAFVGKKIRDNFGKGPNAIHVTITGNFIFIYLKNSISPIEKILLEQKNDDILYQVRHRIMETLLPEVKTCIDIATGKEIVNIFYSWGLDSKSAMILGISNEEFNPNEQAIKDYYGKEELEKKIVSLSYQTHRAPDEINSYQLNPRTLLIIRKGTLVKIEKELIKRGYNQVLESVISDVEKSICMETIDFEQTLKMELVDLFVDWDFDLDISILIFVVRPCAIE